jgi:hypothetical protein
MHTLDTNLGSRPFTTTTRQATTPLQTITYSQFFTTTRTSINFQCGIPVKKSVSLVINGITASPGQFPW